MKKFAILAIVALAAWGLAGCVQVSSDTVIEKDGSGTATLIMSLSPGMADAIKEMEELGMNEGQDMDVPMFDEINKADLEKAAKGKGVKIKKFEKGNTDGRENFHLVLDFEDLKGLSYVMGSVMGDDPGEGMGIFETADGNFILKQANYDFPAEPAKETAATKPETPKEGGTSTLTDEEKAQKQMALMGKMMSSMGELDVKFTITVPGEVIESNAPVVEGNTSTWAINASNMMNQDQSNMEPVISFSSKGLKIKPLKE